MDDDFQIRYRRLPHWRQSGATYFVTWRLKLGQPALQDTERSLVAETLMHFDGQRYAMAAYVVMHDHVHLVAAPLNGHRLDKIIHSWKSFSANRLQRLHGRTGAIWQDEQYDRLVRNEEEFLQKVRYILLNPRRRWPDVDDYLWIGGWAANLE